MWETDRPLEIFLIHAGTNAFRQPDQFAAALINSSGLTLSRVDVL